MAERNYEMGDPDEVLDAHLSLNHEYTIQSETDGSGSFSAPSQASGYPICENSTSRFQRDGTISQPLFHLSSPNRHVPRYIHEGHIGRDNFGFRPTHNFSEHTLIPTNPSTNDSPQSYQAYHQGSAHYTTLQTGPNPVSPAQNFGVHSYGGARVPTQFESNTSVFLLPQLNPLREPSFSAVSNTDDRESYHRSSNLLQSRMPLPPAGFQSYHETPRTLYGPPGPTLAIPGHGHRQTPMASPSSTQQVQSEWSAFPFPTFEVICEVVTENGRQVTVDIHPKVQKGFFVAEEQEWTCYRRNYFSLTAEFTMTPLCPGEKLFLIRDGKRDQIKAFALTISAGIDGAGGKKIELIEHTPKRDNGPKVDVAVAKISPTLNLSTCIANSYAMQGHMGSFHQAGMGYLPDLPYQNVIDPDMRVSLNKHTWTPSVVPAGSTPGTATSHTFDRTQFKHATQNNGKRRASQQYYHIGVELLADIRPDGADVPHFIKFAHRTSERIVVRGRSPSHYANSDGSGRVGRNSAGHSGSGTYGSIAGPSNVGRALTAGGSRGYGAYWRSDFCPGTNQNQVSYGPPATSFDSESIPESVEDEEGPSHFNRYEDDRGDPSLPDANYTYNPTPIIEAGHPHAMLPLTKIESFSRGLTEPRNYLGAVDYQEPTVSSSYNPNVSDRSQVYPTSRGFFPNLDPNGPQGPSGGYP